MVQAKSRNIKRKNTERIILLTITLYTSAVSLAASSRVGDVTSTSGSYAMAMWEEDSAKT